MKNIAENQRLEGMHARLRLEENGREIAREIAGYGGRERVRMKATKREKIIHSRGERRGRRTGEGEAKQEG